MGQAQTQGGPCQKIRFADIGWTDVSLTTAIAAQILEGYGLKTDRKLLSVPVTFRALKDGEIDVFLGNWMPSMAADIAPYSASGDIESIHAILQGAQYTLAVPAYVAQAGITSFYDLTRFRQQFGGKIYGIEPGNDGNRLIQRLIKSPDFKLDTWKLVESSEQAMLAEVMRAVEAKEWIVFLAWSPHPMNKKIGLHYLKDGDRFFGANFGGAQVFTNTRRGLTQDCPAIGQFLKNLEFTVAEINELMEKVTDGSSPDAAAATWIAAHRERIRAWALPLGDGPTTEDQSNVETQKERGKLGVWIQQGLLKLIKIFDRSTRQTAHWTNQKLQTTIDVVGAGPPEAMIIILGLLAWFLQRRWQTVIFTISAMGLVWTLGYWQEAWETLVLVLVASLLALSLGIPMGILAAKSALFYRWLRPFLDMMQTLPTFVYLIPTLMLFGLGMTSGLVATVVFVLPVSIRLSFLGFDGVPGDLKELGKAFGAGFWQTLWKIELPYAWPTLRTAVSQSLMLALSMVVVAALVGADGLGRPVVQALNTVDLAKGIEAGLAIVAIAMMLDRLVHTTANTSPNSNI
jgi:glycine betaine/proline transport system substrate-binding protein